MFKKLLYGHQKIMHKDSFIVKLFAAFGTLTVMRVPASLLCVILAGSAGSFAAPVTTPEQATMAKTFVQGSINEYAPVVYPLLSYDGRTMYFSRKYHPDNVGRTRDADDVWSCTKDTFGRWSEAVNERSLNTLNSDVLCSLSPDGSTGLLARTLITNLKPRVQLFIVQRLAGSWSAPTPVTIDGGELQSSHVYAHLAFDNRTLFLSLEQPGRGMDVSVCSRVSTSNNSSWTFSAPVSLGDRINTRGTEGSPFLAFDGRTLFFTSDGRGGSGSQDVYVTRRSSIESNDWSEPTSLGTSVNTGALDHCFSLAADGASALIVSSDSLHGSGVFSIRLPQSSRMGASMVKDVRIAEQVDLTQRSSATRTRASIDTLQLECKFEVNSYGILDSAFVSALRVVALQCLSKNVRVMIHGHTDSTGTTAHNAVLSKKRAQAVRAAVEQVLRAAASESVSASAILKISCASFGSSMPAATNTTAEGRAQNRRATVRLLISNMP
jgi:outer membrane protein OmpA-like peptidoglycan-associated protein